MTTRPTRSRIMLQIIPKAQVINVKIYTDQDRMPRLVRSFIIPANYHVTVLPLGHDNGFIAESMSEYVKETAVMALFGKAIQIAKKTTTKKKKKHKKNNK